MPYWPHSTASDMVIACTAALAIAEGTTKAEPVQIHVVSVDNAPGRPSAIQRLPAAWVVWNEPFMTVAVIAVERARAQVLGLGDEVRGGVVDDAGERAVRRPDPAHGASTLS